MLHETELVSKAIDYDAGEREDSPAWIALLCQKRTTLVSRPRSADQQGSLVGIGGVERLTTDL